jgi:uncharacterized protein (TIGR02421 family)
MALPDPELEHRALVRDLSDRLIGAQSEIRVLDAVKWDDGVRKAFFDRGCRDQPPVDAAYYDRRPLAFDLDAARLRFLELDTEIATRLGSATAAAQLLRRNCEQYRLTLDLLANRGTPEFGTYATLLYGTPEEVFHAGGPTVEGLADSIEATLALVEPSLLVERSAKDLSGAEAVALLQARLDSSMGPGLVDVKLDDGIVADAAAGATSVKLRADARFSHQDVATLEAHEGWVHVGTTLNGLAQPVCTFLGRAAPPATVTQEGLATLTELLAMRSHPGRLRRIVNRIRGIRLALDGATFVEVFEHFRVEGLDQDEAWTTTARLFRGSTPGGPPFTKDLAYGKGLVLTYVYVRLALRQGRPERIPMLFCGKVDLQALGLVSHLFDEGLVDPPRFVPPPFADLEALAAQVAFSRFLRELDFDRLEAEYGQLL